MPIQEDSTKIKQTLQQAEYDFGVAIDRVHSWVEGGIRLLPNLIVALLVIALFYAMGALARVVIRRRTSRRHRDNLGEVLGGFVRWAIIVLGFLLGATIVIPSMKPGDLIAGLGISSVAIGFAFKDILQNWLAGLLILLRQPFENNDQIKVNNFEGTVERIETRATIIRTYEGERILIPNSEIYTNALLVKTAHEKRRSQYDVGIGYGDNMEHACDVLLAAVKSVTEVELDPAPDALPWDLAASWVTIRVRWWTHSRRADVIQVHARVILAIKKALDETGIDMPFETQVHLFHDQTEEEEGNRARQREGWPPPREGATLPRWKAREGERSKIFSNSEEMPPDRTGK